VGRRRGAGRWGPRRGAAAGAGKKGGGRLEVDDGTDGWAPSVGGREREEGGWAGWGVTGRGIFWAGS
jgi:hypothetical protein